MHEAKPSRTALRVALRRAAHQLHDHQPLVFDDPLAVRILGVEHGKELERTPDSERRPYSAGMRAWMVARARLAEDVLAAGIQRAQTTQYLVLGAGLDTFAYRNPYAGLKVFEVDHPATQAWKRDCLARAGIAVPDGLAFAPVDFEEGGTLAEALAAAGFDRKAPACFSWLGVTIYLTE